MKSFFSRSIKYKLVGVGLLTTLLSLLAALAAVVVYDGRNYHRSVVADMTAQADLLGRTSESALVFNDPKVAKENLDVLKARPKVRAAAVYNARGAMFASYSAAGDAETAFPRLPELDGVRVEGGNIIVFKRITDANEILGTVYLRADYELIDHVVSYVGIAALALAAAMLIALFVSAYLQRIVTRPITAMAAVAREVVDGRDYSRRTEKASEDEIGALADSFNVMLAEIERRTGELERSNAGLAHEIGERRRAEDEIRNLNAELERRVKDRTNQLEAANKELEAFCYSVSHDLRAPLRAIDGFSQVLLEDYAKDLSPESHRYLLRIRSSTQRMGQLIEDLLNLSRVSRGSLDRREVDFSALARQVIQDLAMREPDRKIEISVWDAVRADADPRLLRAALENLIGNAWKFTSKTASPRIEVGALRDGPLTTYYVKDNGAGFDMAYASKLFTAFQRLHAANDYTGTGIGLATVQRIVSRHGGRIWADAQVGAGAVFYFTLPPAGESQGDGRVRTENAA